MAENLLITFREALEASLIVGIILLFLKKSQLTRAVRTLWFAVFVGIVASILVGCIVYITKGEFEGSGEALFEGLLMLIGWLLISSLIVYHFYHRPDSHSIQGKVDRVLSDGQRAGIFLLVFVSIFREGLETVLFMAAINVGAHATDFIGAIIGIALGISVSYLFFKTTIGVNLKTVFTVTTVLLIMIAAGLLAHGIHELQEAGTFPVIKEHLYDINPAQRADGSFPVLHEKGAVGSIFAALFGYNGNPSLLEVLAYIGYIIIMLLVWRLVARRPEKVPATN